MRTDWDPKLPYKLWIMCLVLYKLSYRGGHSMRTTVRPENVGVFHLKPADLTKMLSLMIVS